MMDFYILILSDGLIFKKAAIFVSIYWSIYSKTQYISFGFVLCVLDGLMKY